MRQICLDTETTGVEANNGDRIVEIGCVEIIGRQLSDDECHFHHRYVNPERDVPEEVVRVHGLDNAFLADKPVFAEIADDFLQFVKGAELIIHNAEFDVGFLNAELKRLGKGRIQDYCPKITDSLAMARSIFPGLKNTLDVLCSRYEIDNSARKLHGALLDAQLLAEVYLAMTRKQGSLIGDTIDEVGENLPPLPDASLLIAAQLPQNEQSLHDDFIAMINKKSKKGAMWTKVMSPSETADLSE
ncbi:MAG: DNA polymerase III subunit epsilon [Duodenibacillus sp.]|nr:DNA polymerase III subunit epsilon [Duodenibacillus sp.]